MIWFEGGGGGGGGGLSVKLVKVTGESTGDLRSPGRTEKLLPSSAEISFQHGITTTAIIISNSLEGKLSL